MVGKLITFVWLFFCVKGASYGDVWKLYASYPTPGPNPRGYSSLHPGAGYIVMDGAAPRIYYYSWERAAILSSFRPPGGPGAWGIFYRDPELYITNNLTSWIYKTTTQGSVITSFRCPLDGPADLGFKAYYPVGLLVAIPDRNLIALLDWTTGSLVGTYAGPGSRPTAASGYAHIYIADAGTHTIYENGVPIITGIQNPVGLGSTWFMEPPYDKYIYVIDDATDRYYFYYRSSSGVEPASLGRVKALFQ